MCRGSPDSTGSGGTSRRTSRRRHIHGQPGPGTHLCDLPGKPLMNCPARGLASRRRFPVARHGGAADPLIGDMSVSRGSGPRG